MPLGAAVHGRPGTERLDLNLDTLWSGGPAVPGVWCDPGDVAPLRAAVAAGDHRRADELARALQSDRWVQAFQPAGCPSGNARELRVRGGDAVDLEWRDGVLSSVVLHALATREVTIDVPGDGQVRIRRRVSLQAGETVTVVAP